jgi:hypothetical protein
MLFWRSRLGAHLFSHCAVRRTCGPHRKPPDEMFPSSDGSRRYTSIAPFDSEQLEFRIENDSNRAAVPFRFKANTPGPIIWRELVQIEEDFTFGPRFNSL